MDGNLYYYSGGVKQTNIPDSDMRWNEYYDHEFSRKFPLWPDSFRWNPVDRENSIKRDYVHIPHPGRSVELVIVLE